MKKHRSVYRMIWLSALVICTGIPFSAANSYAITIPTVPIGNPGNANDTRYIDSSHPSGVGAVSNSFNIGKTEVTNAQYVAFLQAVAANDPYGLYNTNMGSGVYGGITRS